MTPTEAERIGRAWVEAGGGWMAGMLAVTGAGHPFRLYVGSSDVLCGQGEGVGGFVAGWITTVPMLDAWPDPRDAATVGAMWGRYREGLESGTESWAEPIVFGHSGERQIGVFTRRPPMAARMRGTGPTEPEALVAALVAAPKGAA